MTNITLRVSGIDGVRRWLDPKRINRAMQRAIRQIAIAGRAIVAQYPTAGPWNAPKPYPGRWYQRGFGTRYRTKAGLLRGRNTSQNLQKSWTWQRRGPMSASIFTKKQGGGEVDYAQYLHLPGKRVDWAAAHGWRTLDEIGDEIAAKVVDRAVDKALKEAFG